MKTTHCLKAAGKLLLALALWAILLVALVGWNWLREPIERMTLAKTGRQLVIAGDLTIQYGWPLPSVRAHSVTFANPQWATEKHMVRAEAVEVSVNLPQLLRRKLVFSDVRLQRPVIFLEKGSDGRKNWLLDLQQQDESAQILVERVSLDRGTLGYDDAPERTSLRAEISTDNANPGSALGAGLHFNANGSYKGLPATADGSGDPVLALRDEVTPYALSVNATLGRTTVQAIGKLSSLSKLSALDMHLKLRGDSLEQLFPLLGIAAPATPAYRTEGHLIYKGNNWRYEKFSGLIGRSDIAGNLQLTLGGKRPRLTATLASTRLDLADFGPIIGSRPGSVHAAQHSTRPLAARLLPDLPFKPVRWDSVDAEVELRAETIRGSTPLPLKNLLVHLSLIDSVLRLDPIQLTLAGGHLSALISLDGLAPVILAKANVQATKIRLQELFTSKTQGHTRLGQLNAEFVLAGHGNSVADMLASADGKAQFVVLGGSVSKLAMEKAGLHLWEILELTFSGDKPIQLRCALADFSVSKGQMQARTLIFDTEVTTLIGSGSIDLHQERLNLTFNQETKEISPLALRSPIYLRGSFAQPTAGVDVGRVAVRALGAVGLGLMNPFLGMIPLIDSGPGKDRDCAQLTGAARKKM